MFKKKKDAFIESMRTEISVRTSMLDWYNDVFVPNLNRFNGRLLNKLLWNRLNENKPDGMNISVRDNSVQLSIITSDGVDVSLFVRLIIQDKRLRVNETLEDFSNKRGLASFVKDLERCHTSISCYDAFEKIANDAKVAMDLFNGLPSCFKNNVRYDALERY